MKSSSLGARLFEGLVQPILGSLWNSPPAALENSGDKTNISSGKETHVQRRLSRDQPSSGRGEAPAMRSSVYQQRRGSCNNDGTRIATTVGISSLKRPPSVPTRSLSSGVRATNAATSRETDAIYAGTPPTAERASHKRQKRALQRQAVCRSKEGQRTNKGMNDSLAATSVSRCVVRHRTGDAPGTGASVPVMKSERAGLQKGERRGESTLTQASVRLYGKTKYTVGQPDAPSVVALEGGKSSAKNVAISPPPARTVDAADPLEWDAVPPGAGGAAYSCSGHDRNRRNNSGPDNCGPTVRTALRSYNKCNSGSDCSSSSSWGGDECALPCGKNSLSLGGSLDHMDLKRSGQAWWTVSAQSAAQHPQRKQLQQRLKQQHGQAQRDLGAFKHAVSPEEGSPEAQLHSCQYTAAPSASVSMGSSCSAGPSSSRLQCSDTTTTCSGSSMTTCGDSRDTATGSATMAPEHQQQYLDIEEQMPLAFPTIPAGDSSRTLFSKNTFPYAKNNASTPYSSSLEPASVGSSFSCADAAVQTSSNPSALLTLTSSTSTTAESIQSGGRGCNVTSSHSILLPYEREGQEATGPAEDDLSSNIRAHCALICNTSRHPQQQLHLQNSAAGAVAASSYTSVRSDVAAGHQGDCCNVETATEACAADKESDRDQQGQQQQRQAEGHVPGSVVFGHRVLKPLRSKCLEENYDALVEIVAFTKRRCERETMELLRKDVHILYYARGLHHAAHVETYLRQQQNQQEKQQQGATAAPGNDTTTTTFGATSLSVSSAHPVPQCASDNAPPAASTIDAPSTDKRSPAAPCFPSVSAALAGGARPQAVPDWATPQALRDALERQQCYDPFSIFGEAPPELLLSEVYDEQHYTHISPQTRASHPVLARLKHQRSAALMAVFQQKRAALARTQQLLEHEIRQLQRKQRTTFAEQQVLREHGSFSSVLGRAVFSCSSGTAAVKGAAAMKTDMCGKDGGGSSLLQLKKVESEENPESKSNKDKEAMLRLQQRDVLVQQQLLERRLEEQLQQEERVHAELLRNGFRFLGGRVNGGESGAALFRKWVLPALESWWQQQCQVELDWRNDPLTSEECSWYREVMNAAVDASDLISVQQACFCPTPPPYRQWTWTDCRVRQRQQHEQKLAKLRQQQEVQQQQLVECGRGPPTGLDWIAGANAEQSDVEGAAEVGKCAACEEEVNAAADRDGLPPLQEDTAAERPHSNHQIDVVREQHCAHGVVTGSVAPKQNDQPLSGHTPSRKGRKRRAKGDRTPQGCGNNIETPGSDRETAEASNSGSARKRPRSFCRQAKNLHAQTERSQHVQTVAECCSDQCACGIRLSKKDTLAKQHFRPTSAAKSDTLFPASASPAASEADKSCYPTGNVRSTGAIVAIHWQQPFCQLNEQKSGEENSGNAMTTAGTCNLAGRGNGRGISSPCRERQAGHAFSTPVAKMQALKLSKQQRFTSAVPSQQAQLRERAVDRGQQHYLQSTSVAPPNKTAVLRQVASPGDQSFVSPIPAAATTKTPGCHLVGNWRGSGCPPAAGRLAWDRKAATADTPGVSAAAGGAGCFGNVDREDGYSNTAARGASGASFSTSTGEARCRATKILKQLKMGAAQRRTKQLQKQGIRSTRAVQESCLPTCKPDHCVQVPAGTGTHSRLPAAAVREINAGKFALAERPSSGFLRKGTRGGDSSTSKNLYLMGGRNVRATTLHAVRGARLSIDRVYGCRRTSDFLHGRAGSQFVLESLVRPAITFAAGTADECSLTVDDLCKKDIECISNGAL